MKIRTSNNSYLDRLFKKFGDADEVVVTEGEYEYKIKRKRRQQ